MVKSIVRYFKGIWYALIGRVQKRTNKHTQNLKAVRDAYDVLIRVKQEDVQSYKNAIGQLIALVENKKNSLKGLTDDIDKLEQMKEGAIAKAESTAAALQKIGIPEKEIEQHPDYVLHITSYNDYHSTLEEKNARVAKIEQDIERAQEGIESHKLQITSLHRDLNRFKTEQSEAVADLLEASERRDIADTLTSIK